MRGSLTALVYPLGLYIARVFEPRHVHVTEGWFYRLVRTAPDPEDSEELAWILTDAPAETIVLRPPAAAVAA